MEEIIEEIIEEINWEKKYNEAKYEIKCLEFEKESLEMRLEEEREKYSRRFNQWHTFQINQFRLSRVLQNVLKHFTPHHKSERQKKIFLKADQRLREGSELLGSLVRHGGPPADGSSKEDRLKYYEYLGKHGTLEQIGETITEYKIN